MKRFFSVLACSLLLVTIFSKSVFAQTESATPSSQTDNVKQQTTQYQLNVNPDVPQNFHTYTQSIVLELLSAFSCQISGIDPLNPEGQCLGADPKTGKLGFVDNKGGAIGFLNDSINMTFQIPVSSGQYVAVLADRFGIAKPAIAQAPGGYGFNSLLPVLPLWEAIRNIVYIFFVLIFVFIGVGIMFRLHIDPRTVMTIQNSLPKIVMGLIFVTLSYAIAGFLVDMMYVSLYFTHGVVKSAAPNSKGIAGLSPQSIQGDNPFGAIGKVSNSTFGLAGIVSDATGGVVNIVKNAAGMENDKGEKISVPQSSLTDCRASGECPPQEKQDESCNSVIPGYCGLVGGLKKIGNILIPFVDNAPNSYIDIIIDTISIMAGIAQLSHVAQVLNVFQSGTPVVSETVSGVKAGLLIASVPGVYALTEWMLRELLPNLIVFFIVLGIMITALARLWFTLIKSYLYILLHVVLAPFWIAFGLVPGVTSESVGFKPWIRGLIANLAVFPVTYAMILFAKLFLENIKPETGFVPPLIGTQNNNAAFGALFAIGVLLAIPEILNMVKKALKVPEGKMGAGISGAIGMGTGLTKAATAPAATRLIGHKNPITQKFAKGIIPLAGQKILGGAVNNIGQKFPKAGGALGKLGRGLGAITKHPETAQTEREEQQRNDERNREVTQARQAPLRTHAGIDKEETKMKLVLGTASGKTPEEIENASIDELEEEAKKLQENPNTAAITREEASNALSNLGVFRSDLEDIAQSTGITINKGMNIRDIISALKRTPSETKSNEDEATATAVPPIASTTDSTVAKNTVSLSEEAISLIEQVERGRIGDKTDSIERVLKANGITEDEYRENGLEELIKLLKDRGQGGQTRT